MTVLDESLQQEVRSAMASLLGPKTTIRLGAWNVRTMFDTSKTAQVTSEMRRYRLDILGISECRWTGSGRQVRSDGTVILHSGHPDQHTRGVALIVSKEKVNTLLDWEPLGDRLIRARFNSMHCKLTIIQCYASTNEANEEEKDQWYEKLQQTVFKVPQHDMLVIMGDINAKVGADNTDCERAMGKHGCGVMNDNGERLVDFCMTNNYVIGGTIFPHKTIHKLTWKSPDGSTINQIDHILMNGKWRRSLQDVRVYRRADVNSDHYLLTAIIKLKLRKAQKRSQHRKHLDVAKLRCPKTNKEFCLELKNSFSVLAKSVDEDLNTQDKWENIKKSYVGAATKVLGYRKRGNKEWLTPGTWQRIEERKQLKAKMLSTKSPRLHEQVQKAYKDKDREVKKSARSDKRAFVEDLAEKAECAAARGELSTIHKITKQLSGKYTSQSAPVKDKQGNILTTESDQILRWVEHFREVLNCPEPEDPANPSPAERVFDIETTPQVRKRSNLPSKP
uniref:Endonuclease/exonuclease/phosphatase domain-containing protein n=1 Tax=Astyanax mexicanus TaxID=7994 RepID=A0A3B1KAX6_ASTMX